LKFVFAATLIISIALNAYADEDTNWWTEFKSAVDDYVSSIPAEAKGSMSSHMKGFVPIPIGLIQRNKRNKPAHQVLHGEFNCDGKQDYAVIGVNDTDPLAKALLSSQPLPREILKVASERYHSLTFSVPAVVWVGLSEASGFTWKPYSGSYASIRKPFGGDLFEKAKEQLASRAKDGGIMPEIDVRWAHEHRCEVLSIGCCEKPGMDYVWDRRSKQLIAVYLGEC